MIETVSEMLALSWFNWRGSLVIFAAGVALGVWL